MENASYRNRSVGNCVKIWTGNTGRVQVSDDESHAQDNCTVDVPHIQRLWYPLYHPSLAVQLFRVGKLQCCIDRQKDAIHSLDMVCLKCYHPV